MTDIASFWRRRPVLFFVIAAGVIAAARIIGLFLFDANIGPDEAQYWIWSKIPAFGYYSKPPLIAWAIGLTTGLFGDAPWAVRLSAPLFQFGASLYVFALARKLYGEAAGFWSGMGWLLLPGVSLSSALITTDAPLLFFWSASLYYFFRMLTARDDQRSPYIEALLFGAAIGLGFLAKYAMIYFFVGAAPALALSSDLRRGFPWRAGGLALIVAAAVFAPNIGWNAAHHFDTLSHTAANADWGGGFFHPAKFASFLGSQFGIFSIIPPLLLVWGLATLPRRFAGAGGLRRFDLALLCFAGAPLVIVGAEALISRAHANWAAVTYPSAIILVTVWALRGGIRWTIFANGAFNLALAAIFLIAFSNFALIDAVGASNAVKRVRGWPEQGAAVRMAAEDYDAILVDDRELMGSLLYYARGGPPIVAWDSNHRIDSHYEAFMAYDPAKAPRVLFVGERPDAAAIAGAFAKVERIGESTVDLKRGRKRALYFFEASGFKGAANHAR